MKTKEVFLTIAGSDPSGGAGVQSDIKTALRLDLFPCSVISAITAQNTKTVYAINSVDSSILDQQLESVLSDFTPNAVKIGLLTSSDAIGIVADYIKKYELQNVVLDPVLSPTLKHKDPDYSLINHMVEELFPHVSLVTPNINEKDVFERATGKDFNQICDAFLLKGGHAEGENCIDLLYYYEFSGDHHKIPSTAFPTINYNHSSLFDQGNILPDAEDGEWIPTIRKFIHKKIVSENTHGTGCILSSAIACYLAKDFPLVKAVEKGIKFTEDSLIKAKEYRFWQGNYGPSLI